MADDCGLRSGKGLFSAAALPLCYLCDLERVLEPELQVSHPRNGANVHFTHVLRGVTDKMRAGVSVWPVFTLLTRISIVTLLLVG